MSFWEKIKKYIDELAFDHADAYSIETTIKHYLYAKIRWEELPCDIQEILIELQTSTKVKGLIPKKAKLNPYHVVL